MERKILNNKVNFFAGGKDVTIRLSDRELKILKQYSNYHKGDNLDKMTMMEMYNFSMYAYFEYELKGSAKGSRVKLAFPYHDYSTVWWKLVEHKDIVKES